MNTHEALELVLVRNDLARPDGRPLWKYGQAEEHEHLLARFRLFSSCPRNLTLPDQGALALLLARVLCEAKGMSWSWAPVWSALRWPEDLSLLYRHLQDGFELYWRRPIRQLPTSGHRAYLGTCYVEGGLPLGFLHAEHGVGRAIRRLVALSEVHELPATGLAAEGIGSLPESIRGEEVADLSAQIAEALVRLRARLPRGCEAPSKHLDSVDPDWRDELPLRIAKGEDADTVVNSLLSVSASRDGGVRLVEVITLMDAAGRCGRRIRLADKISHQQLINQAELGSVASRLLYLSLQVGRGARRQVARLEQRGDGDRAHWQVVQTDALPTLEGAGEVRAIIGLRGELYAEFVPAGGTALEEDAPWVFVETQTGAFTLVGVGSCSLSRESAVVLLPAASAEPEPMGGESSAAPTRSPFAGRVAFEVRGRVQVPGVGESFEIETSREAPQESLELRGQVLRAASGQEAPYHGPPRVHVRTEGGVVALPEEAVTWRPLHHGGAWRNWSTDPPRGTVVVRVQAPSGRRLRMQARVVPARFRVQKAGSALRIHGPDLERVVGDDATELARDQLGGFCTSADKQTDRADIHLQLFFRGVAPLAISLPVPGGRTGFVDECGKWLPDRARFSIEQLDRIRARDASAEPKQLEVRSRGFTWEQLAQLRPAGEGVAELYLEDLREELLARLRASGSLDDHLELQIVPLGYRDARTCRLEIGHYGLELDASFSDQGALLSARAVGGRALAIEEGNRFSLSMMSLGQPDKAWLEVSRLEDGTWKVAFSEMEPGPYLAVLKEGRAVRGRPRLITIPGSLPENAPTFRVVASMEDTDQRRLAWGRLCDAMAEQWEEPAWTSFRALIATGSPLPSSCFEAMQLAAQRPAFLAQVMLRQVDVSAQRDVMEEFEEVGVFWQALPITAWAAATRALARWLDGVQLIVDALGGPNKARATLCPSMFGASTPELRFLSVLGELAQRANGVGNVQMACLKLPEAMLQGFLQDEMQELCRRHAEEHWPQPRLSSHLEAMAGGLQYPDHPVYRREILAAPYVAAMLALRGQVLDRRDGYALRNARAFDRDWFDAAHTFHLARLIQTDIRRYEELFRYA